MSAIRAAAWLTLGFLTLSGAPAGAQQIDQNPLAEYQAADPSGPPVTQENLLENERLWPYRVHVTKSQRHGIQAGERGVLVRVETDGRARIAFPEEVLEVPVADTDLVDAANQVRTGQLSKDAPNFVVAIGPRMIDTRSDPPEAFPYRDVLGYGAFLTVFVDPRDKQFEQIAAALAPRADSNRVLTILVPRGGQPDATVRERLLASKWKVPFVRDFLAETYVPSLLGKDVKAPTVMLQTAEGRVIYSAAWKGNTAAELMAAWDAHYPEAPTPLASADDGQSTPRDSSSDSQ